MRSVSPMLWYNDQLEEALGYYASIFPDVKVHGMQRHPDGSLFVAEFEVGGLQLKGLNGGPEFTFTEAISLVVECEDQQEVDRYWTALTAEGEESMCGWLKDKYGLSWQIVPIQLFEMLSTGTQEQVERMTQALYKMRKLDIAELQAAFAG